MSSKIVLRVENVTKKFGSFMALDKVSFAVRQGEVVGFVGANGAGKTTTISTILGFIGLTSGQVELFGEVVSPATAHKFHGRIGYAAGDMELPSRLTGRQYLAFVLHQSGGHHQERYDELCQRFQPQLDKKIGELSRGNRQKIALIAACMTEPELLILDEPTSGLDPVMQEVFLDLVREVQAAGGTVFMSSHYLAEVADVCSRVILMRTGTIIEDIDAKDLLEKSGKSVSVLTSYKRTRPPKSADDIVSVAEGELTRMTFVFKGDVAELQQWIASIKQLHDVEITEYNLEGAFKQLYESEQV